MYILIPSFSFDHIRIFEIYPQSETPLLNQIARFDWSPSEEYPLHLLPDTLISRLYYENRMVFRVVDYRTNYSTFISPDIDILRLVLPSRYKIEVFFFLLSYLKVSF